MLSLDFDRRLLREGIQARTDTCEKELPAIINQTAANVVARAVAMLPPQDAQRKRWEIKQYLSRQMTSRVSLNKGTGRIRTRRKVARNNQLQLVHLIVQSNRRKAGLPGLYGDAMRRASGKFKHRAEVSAGFAKAVYIPIIRGLNPVVEYKIPYSLTKSISRWPGSAGFGIVSPAKRGDTPEARFSIAVRGLKQPRGEPRLYEIENRVLNLAMDVEGIEMVRHAESKFGKLLA